MSPLGRGVPAHVLVLHALLLLLPVGALALALPVRPHWFVVLLVVVASALWARSPDHLSGAVSLVLVAGWWAVHGAVDWRVLVVAVLLLGAHLVATVLSHGPPTLAVDPRLARLWLSRGLLAVVPMPVAWLAVRGLDPTLAPSWVWASAGLATVVLLVATARLTQPVSS